MKHASDCAVHNGPALPAGECDCGASIDAASLMMGVQTMCDEVYGLSDHKTSTADIAMAVEGIARVVQSLAKYVVADKKR